MHEDVAAEVGQLAGHALAIGSQRFGDVDIRVHGAYRLSVVLVTHQANGFAGRTQTDGDLRAHRDEIEMLDEDPAAPTRFLVPGVVAHGGAEQAGTDADLGFADAGLLHDGPLLKPVHTDNVVQHSFIISPYL